MIKMNSVYNEVDLAWSAGIIDGEGSVMLMRKARNESPAPQVSVTNTSLNIIKKLHKLFGGSIRKQKKYKKHHIQAFVWGLSHNKALLCLESIQPYLVTSIKSKRAKLLLARYKKVVVKNGRYTSSQKIKFNKFVDKFYSLS